MRTNIEIDDEKMKRYMQLGKFKTKKEAIDDALKQSIRIRMIKELDEMRGENVWEGDLEKMRTYNKWDETI